MAHASWFWWSSCLRLRAMGAFSGAPLPQAALRLVQIAMELRLDRPRILALRDRDHSLDHHLAHLRLLRHDALELSRDRQEEQVRKADAVHSRGERRGDAMTELRRIGEVLHDG